MLKNKVVIITGASSGVGRETALLCAQRGAHVVAASRSRDRLLALKRDVALLGGECKVVPTDITKEEQVHHLIEQTKHLFGCIDILINNAGQGYFATSQETSSARYKQIMDVNFYGAMHACRAVVPMMEVQQSGIIVNVASVAGKRAFPKMSAYCASKFALVGFSEALHHELFPKGIKVITICPPAIDTPFFENAGFPDYKETHTHLSFLTPEEVARKILEALQGKKREVVISRRAQILNAVHAFCPALTDRLMQHFSKGVKFTVK